MEILAFAGTVVPLPICAFTVHDIIRRNEQPTGKKKDYIFYCIIVIR